MQKGWLALFVLLSVLYSGCGGGTEMQPDADKESTEYIENKEIFNEQWKSDYTVRETSISVNGKHRISTFVTRDSGMGILADETVNCFDDIAVRYSPTISNEGKPAWIQQLAGVGYDVMLQGKSVLHSGACLDYLTMGDAKAVCVESDNGQNFTRLYLIDMDSGKCECIAAWPEEYIEETCRYGNDKFGVITSHFDENSSKLYNVYQIDGNEASTKTVAEDVSNPVTFPIQQMNLQTGKLLVDEIRLSDNDRYLYNALRIDLGGGYNEAFAYGNDFRGRLSWSESERMRGLCELYKKTNDTELYERIIDVIGGILDARNKYIGIEINEWNPEFLWSEKAYSIGQVPVSILIENGEVISMLLAVCNEGIVKKYSKEYKEIIDTGIKALEYYGQWYRDGHYYLPHGFPMANDGIVVPWNFQNSMAEVALGLYIETEEQKYLEHCDELIMTFMSEWTEEEDRIYWHYWPQEYYDGWIDDGRSSNTPSADSTGDTLFEDASHAGISVRLLARYMEYISEGAVSEHHISKVESNMKYFCFKDGFSRFISGDEEYVPRAWHYWISPYYSYLHNDNYEKYVRQGYLKCFPEWDSQESLFANAKLYDSTVNGGDIVIIRNKVLADGSLKDMEQIMFTRDELKNFIWSNY